MSPIRKCLVTVSAVLFSLIAESEMKRYHSIGGPFKVVIKRIEKCPPQLDGRFTVEYSFRDVRTKYTQEPTYSGNASIPFHFNNTISGHILIASWSNMGGWKDNAHVIHSKPICRSLEYILPSLWNPWLISIYGEIVPCYFLPGRVQFDHFKVAMRDMPVKHFLYGRWRADLQLLFANGDVAGCIRGYGDTVPV